TLPWRRRTTTVPGLQRSVPYPLSPGKSGSHLCSRGAVLGGLAGMHDTTTDLRENSPSRAIGVGRNQTGPQALRCDLGGRLEVVDQRICIVDQTGGVDRIRRRTVVV